MPPFSRKNSYIALVSLKKKKKKKKNSLVEVLQISNLFISETTVSFGKFKNSQLGIILSYLWISFLLHPEFR